MPFKNNCKQNQNHIKTSYKKYHKNRLGNCFFFLKIFVTNATSSNKLLLKEIFNGKKLD